MDANTWTVVVNISTETDDYLCSVTTTARAGEVPTRASDAPADGDMSMLSPRVLQAVASL